MIDSNALKFDIITLFPEMFKSPLAYGVVGQALISGRLSLEFHNPRQFTSDVHKTVDDRPFGGGDGMVMMAEPLERALAGAKTIGSEKAPVIYLSPQGRHFTDALARDLAKEKKIILVCGRYGGIDQRFLTNHVDYEFSIGDYVLSGGELAALVLIDAVARFVPGVLGNELSHQNESFSNGLLEFPQFTRPREYENLEVPPILLSGNHAKIKRWRYLVSLLRTKQNRPDLLGELAISKQDWVEASGLFESMLPRERQACGLKADHESV